MARKIGMTAVSRCRYWMGNASIERGVMARTFLTETAATLPKREVPVGEPRHPHEVCSGQNIPSRPPQKGSQRILAQPPKLQRALSWARGVPPDRGGSLTLQNNHSGASGPNRLQYRDSSIFSLNRCTYRDRLRPSRSP